MVSSSVGGPLLFIFVVGSTAYLLDLLDHDAFADEDLIEILHTNWPDMMAAWRSPGAVPGSLSPKYTSEQRKQMRKKFTISTETKDGTIYLPPGGGIMTSGHSFDAVRHAYRILNFVRPAEDWVRDNTEWIMRNIEGATGTRPTALHLRFLTWHSMHVGAAVLYETRTRAMLSEVPPLPGTEPWVLLTAA